MSQKIRIPSETPIAFTAAQSKNLPIPKLLTKSRGCHKLVSFSNGCDFRRVFIFYDSNSIYEVVEVKSKLLVSSSFTIW